MNEIKFANGIDLQGGNIINANIPALLPYEHVITDTDSYSAGAYVLAHNLGTKQVGVSVFNITDEAYSPITGINFTAVSENETKVFFAYKPSPNALKIVIHKI